MIKLEFCSCGGMLVPSKGGMKCRTCGKEVQKTTEKIKLTEEKKKEEIVVIEDNRPDLPTTEKECDKCKNNEAYYWLIQTRSSDEPPTQFFKCTNTKCNHVWREYK